MGANFYLLNRTVLAFILHIFTLSLALTSYYFLRLDKRSSTNVWKVFICLKRFILQHDVPDFNILQFFRNTRGLGIFVITISKKLKFEMSDICTKNWSQWKLKKEFGKYFDFLCTYVRIYVFIYVCRSRRLLFAKFVANVRYSWDNKRNIFKDD